MNWIKSISVFLIVTVISIKCADLLLGYLAPESSFGISERGVERSLNVREINPHFNAVLWPSEEYKKRTDSLESKGYVIRTDEFGFIENGNEINFSEKKSKSIIFLGGSTTEQLYISEKSRWSSVLERNLNKMDQENSYIIRNGGFSGNNSMHSNLNLIAKALPLSPDFVVLMHNVNDLGLLRLTGSYWQAPKKLSLIEIHENESSIFLMLRQIKDYLIPNSYNLLKNTLSQSNNDDYKEYRGSKIKGMKLIEDQFRRSLNTFIDVSLAWGTEPILMTQFNRINLEDELFNKTSLSMINKEEYVETYFRLNDVIREVSVSRNVDLIDLANLIPSSSNYIYDTVHLNENGSKLAAEILTDYWFKKLELQ
tara:strand:+ start:197 stop:1300 length:1104 start_codon:yes stop_codon:yes gene_type:complete